MISSYAVLSIRSFHGLYIHVCIYIYPWRIKGPLAVIWNLLYTIEN